MELKKIATAIFLGIFVGAMVVLLLTITPLLRWLLGVLVGTSMGFLWYDLKEVWEKAPLAWQRAKKGSRYSLNWLKKPHPILFFTLVLLLISALCSSKLLWLSNITGGKDVPIESKIIGTVLLSIWATMMTTVCCLFILGVVVKAGIKKKKMFFQGGWGFSKEEMKKMIEKQYTQIPLNYGNFYGLMLTGLGYIALEIGRGIGIGLRESVRFICYGMWVFLAKFLLYLFKLISSHERILCAIYCAAGVTAIHILFGRQEPLLGQKIIIAVSGGIIGAAVGAIHYWLIQLFLTPATNNA